MVKNIKFLIVFFSLILNIGCSFDNKTGIWHSKEKERISEIEKKQKQNKKEIVKLFSPGNTNLKEIPAIKKINLKEPKKNLSWQMKGLNLQNSIGNIYLPSIKKNFLKKKIGKNKFKLSKITSTPLILNNNIFFADDTGSIFSINQKGKINWKKNIYKKIYKKIYKNLSLVIDNNKIYVADNIGFIYSINIENGELIWIKNHGIPIKSNIKVFDNKIFLINQDNRLLCLDSKKGSIIWDLRSISPFIKSQNFLSMAISEDGYLVMLSSSGDLVKVNTKNGQMHWSLNVLETNVSYGTDFFKSSDIVIEDNEIIFSTTSSVFSFDINSAYLRWKKNLNSQNTPIIVSDYLFLVSNNGFFLNLDKNSGKTIWSTNLLKVLKKKKQNTVITGFILGSGKIYATTLNGYLIVSSASSGQVEYFRKIGDKITSAPIISNGALYILTKESRILGFN